MNAIVCATRGGEASRRTQERAIALAREREAPLTFLFVADTNFAHPSGPALAEALADELSQLGRRLLSIARERAEEQGVFADVAIRRGSVRSEIEDFLREANAGTLILGAPGTGSEKKTFLPEELPQFAQEINANTGVEVILVG